MPPMDWVAERTRGKRAVRTPSPPGTAQLVRILANQFGQSAAKRAKVAARQIYEHYRTPSKATGPFGYPLQRGLPQYLKTPGGGTSVVKRVGAVSSKSAGFIKKGNKLRKSNPLNRIMRKGIIGTYERGGVLTASNCRYVGHATHSVNLYRQLFTRSLMKLMSVKMGVPCRDLTDVIPDLNTTAGQEDTWIMYWKASDDAAATVQSLTITPAAGDRWIDIADAIDTWFGTLSETRINVFAFTFQPSVTATVYAIQRIHLEGARIHFDMKSALKIQNRSLNADGGQDADDVDNTPLYGKTYEGKGNGTRYYVPYVDEPKQPLIGDALGLISFNGEKTGMKEPPQGFQLERVKAQGKVHLDPGQIKTSVITSRGSIGLDVLINYCINFNATTNPLMFTGKFRIMALEKMINTVATADQIVVAYELNLRYGSWLSTRLNTTTNMIFDRNP